jgi:hypothetical protein
MTFWQRKELAQHLRAIPLETVLPLCGAQKDHDDKRKWHTPAGVLSVTGAKFMNWNHSVGGGGAIDLVMHLHHLDFKAAVDWLAHHFPGARLRQPVPPNATPPSHCGCRPQIPASSGASKSTWSSARNYPNAARSAHPVRHSVCRHPSQRRLPATRKRKPPRGGRTARHHPACLAWLGARLPKRPRLLRHSRLSSSLCRSASSFVNRPSTPSVALPSIPNHRCLSTAGARPNPRWLQPCWTRVARSIAASMPTPPATTWLAP